MRMLTMKSLTAATVLVFAAACAGPAGDPGTNGSPGAVGATGDKGVRGDKGDSGKDGTGSLTNLSDEAPGEFCQYGGYRIEVGIDSNGNNVLDPNEIDDAATRRICNEAPADRVLFGDVIVRTDAELAELNTYDGVNGDVFIDFDDMDTVTTLKLTVGFVTGNLRLVGGKNTTAIVLPRLASSGSIKVDTPTVETVALPELVIARGLNVANMQRLRNLDLSALKTVGSLMFTSTGIVDLSAPLLEYVQATISILGNDVLESVDFPNLQRVREGELEIAHNRKLESLALPALVRAQSVVVEDNEALESVSFLVLTRVETLTISNNDVLDTISTPKLVKWAAFEVTHNPMLSECAFAEFEAGAFSSITVSDNLDDMDTCTLVWPPCVRLTDADGDTPWMACSSPKTFSAAHTQCEGLDGTLASFADADEYARFIDFYESGLMGELWVGYRDSGSGYAWTDESAWAPEAGEFWASAPTNGECADFGRHGELLASSRDCDVQLRFVCSVPLTE